MNPPTLEAEGNTTLNDYTNFVNEKMAMYTNEKK